MGLTAKKPEGGNFEPVSQGLHQAVCYALYDLGTQFQEKFGKLIHKVLIGWEIPEERIEIEKDGVKKNLPRAISKEYTLSLHEKSILRKELESFRGKPFSEAELEGFDLTKIIGANCMLQILHKTKDGKTYANVANVVQLPKGMTKKVRENPAQYFSFEEHQDNIPDNTPDWIKDKIKASEEWAHITNGETPVDDRSVTDGDPRPVEDDIPF